MKREHEIIDQVKMAQRDSGAADQLILKYMPFIRSETAKYLGRFVDDIQDELNIAMFAFYEAIVAYQVEKGSFLSLAKLTIRNRLIDYERKEKRHQGMVSLDEKASDDSELTLQDQLEDETNQVEELHTRSATQKEIEEFVQQLESFGLSLSDISDNCPRQERTLLSCMEVLDYARAHTEIFDQLLDSKKLPITQLAKGSGVPKKTLERHRKYLIAILLAYTNGFEIIRGHLRMIKRKEGA